MDGILKTKGASPRVYRNTIFFLFPMESERSAFITALKRHLAYESISNDKTLNLS